MGIEVQINRRNEKPTVVRVQNGQTFAHESIRADRPNWIDRIRGVFTELPLYRRVYSINPTTQWGGYLEVEDYGFDNSILRNFRFFLSIGHQGIIQNLSGLDINMYGISWDANIYSLHDKVGCTEVVFNPLKM